MSTAISTAIGVTRRASTSGYEIKKGFFNESTNNLPQIIVILGEANTANQGSLSLTAKEITSANQAGGLYGFGSPIYAMMNILRPPTGDGVGGIPTIVIPQASANDATAKVMKITVTGAVTKNRTHYLQVAGRESYNQTRYSFDIAIGDTVTQIATKISDAINSVPGSPVTATSALGVVTVTTKWKGLTAESTNLGINVDGDSAGVSYAIADFTAGSGAVNLQPAFDQFEDNWYTTVINSYGEDALEALEAFNGFPSEPTPTGRFEGRIFKPFIAFFGNCSSDIDELTTITDEAGRIAQCTNVLCPAPNSEGFPFEAAANMVAIFSRVAQDNPHLDVDGLYYPDMPVPSNLLIGDMADYNVRDFLVKKGCSTVVMKNGKYQATDLVTTYHDGDTAYCYPRNLNIDFNVKNGYSVLESIRVKGHVIVADKQVTDVAKAIKPKEWKSVLMTYFDSLGEAALLENPQFSKDSLVVQKSTTNTDRFETTFSYKRTGFARIQSTTATAGF